MEANSQQLHERLQKYISSDYNLTLLKILEGNGMSSEEAHSFRQRVSNSYDLDFQSKLNFSPHTVTINPTSACNFKCIMCDVPSNNRGAASIDLDKLLPFLEQLYEAGVRSCILGSGAEITLYSDWKKLVTITTGIFPDVLFMTNGSLIHSADIEFLVKSRVSRVFFSLDASTSETFTSIRGFNLLTRIESTIQNLINFRSMVKSLSPLVRVSFVVQDENRHEMSSFKSKWQDIVDSIEFQQHVDIRAFRDASFASDIHIGENVKINHPHCHYPWGYISVWADGSVSSCCTSYGRDSKSLHYCNIKDPISSQDLKQLTLSLQQSFLTNELPDACTHCLLAKGH